MIVSQALQHKKDTAHVYCEKFRFSVDESTVSWGCVQVGG